MSKATPKKVERNARLRWIPIPQIRVSPQAQRELNEARANKIAANMDLEQIGTPTVSERDGHFWVIDGQHRIEALRRADFASDNLQCWVYTGLTEEDEAEVFLKLNDTLSVDLFSKFRIGVEAGREEECDIDRIVRAQGLRVSRDKIDGAVRAVGTLSRVYRRSDGPTLGRTLRIIRDGFGDAGLEAPVIDGLGYVTQKYNGKLDDDDLVTKLGNLRGGVAGLLNQAELTHRQTGRPKSQCVAATFVTIANRGRKGPRRLNDWWSA